MGARLGFMALGRQFIPVGADDATRRRAVAKGDTRRAPPRPLVDNQLQLKGLNKVPMAEPHQQSQDEFARDPRTWFHGRYSEHLPGDGPDTDEFGEEDTWGDDYDEEPDNTFHVGTRKAAEDRLKKIGPGFRTEPGYSTSFDQPGRVFPSRIAERMTNSPEKARADRGQKWPNLSTGQFYQNDFEDPGSVSAVLPGRGSVRTHHEFIQEAIEKGSYIRPRVAAEHKAMGDRQYDPELNYVHPHSTEGRERTTKEIAAKYPADARYPADQQTSLFRGGAVRPMLVPTPTALSGHQWENVPEPWEYHNQKD